MACPKCGCKVHYQYDDGDFGPCDENQERCAACGHVFHIEDSADEDGDHEEGSAVPSGVPVLAAANPGLDQGPCAVCCKPWREHGTAPVYESHNYTPASGVLASHPSGPVPEDSYPDQTVLHAEGQCGNCLQATIAGVLGWPLAAVPHFALLGEDHWWDCLQAWIESQGYWIDYKPNSYAVEGGELLPRC